MKPEIGLIAGPVDAQQREYQAIWRGSASSLCRHKFVQASNKLGRDEEIYFMFSNLKYRVSKTLDVRSCRVSQPLEPLL